MDGVVYHLPELETAIWTMLSQGSTAPKNTYKTAALASLGNTGIGLRTVVLRQVDQDHQTLFFYSDYRAPKIAEIQTRPTVSCLFYDDRRRIQIRASGRGFVHWKDTISEAHWQRSSPANRKNYLSHYTPGSVVETPTDGLPEEMQGRQLPTPEASEAGKSTFAVIRLEVSDIDWLWLGDEGHRRAQFFYQNGTLRKMQWVTP